MVRSHGDLQHEMPQVRANPDVERDMQSVRGIGTQSGDLLRPDALSVNGTDGHTLTAHTITYDPR